MVLAEPVRQAPKRVPSLVFFLIAFLDKRFLDWLPLMRREVTSAMTTKEEISGNLLALTA